jgi:hypothetical protein
MLEDLYDIICRKRSDINEHLPLLRELASKSDHVTEFGFRKGISTMAMLAGKPKKLITYDIDPKCHPVYISLKTMVADTNFQFICTNTLTTDIEKTDFLFIDSLHNFCQCRDELFRHSDRVGKTIAFHDTTTFGHKDEHGKGPGLMPAINLFLSENKNWELTKQLHNNNGFVIIERIPCI